MGRTLRARVVLIAVSLVLTTMTMWAQDTYYVRTAGNDANDGLSIANAKATIQAAVTAAASGDIIDVGPGTYAENISITKGLSFIGPNAGKAGTDASRTAEAVIDVSTLATVSGRFWQISTTDAVSIDGFSFVDNGAVTAAGNRALIQIVAHGGHVITNNIIKRVGTATYTTGDASPRGVELSAVGAGASVTVTNNVFSGNSAAVYSNANFRSGIYTNGGSGTTTITHNTFEYCRTAMNLDDATSGVVVDDNIFTSNGTAISYGGTTPTTGSHTISGNAFTSNGATINLSNVATTFRLDATDNTYNGKTVAAMSLSELWTLEGTMWHGTRAGRNGFVRVKTGNMYVVSSYAINKNLFIYAETSDIVHFASGTYALPASGTMDMSTPVTVKGYGAATISGGIGVGTYFMRLLASGITLEGMNFSKTDKTGVQNLLYIGGANSTIDGCTFTGQYVLGDGDVSRAMEKAVGVNGLTVVNSTISALRQPGYLNSGTVTITNTSVSGTRGWVVDQANVTFSGNSWGAVQNAVDIAILSGTSGLYYTDLLALSTANSNARINDQRVAPALQGRATVYVNDATGNDANAGAIAASGSAYGPKKTVAGGLSDVLPGGTVNLADATYSENVTVSKRLTLQGASSAGTIIRGSLAPSNAAEAVLWVNASNVTVRTLTVSRDIGANLAAWYAGTNNQGISVGQTTTGVVLEDLIVKDQRNGIYVNNAQNVTIRRCDIHDTRTGLQFVNNISGLVCENNEIHDNFTHGLFLNLAGTPNLTNVSVQNNSIHDNWFSQILVKENGSAPITTGMLWTCNWLGTATPSVKATATSEPGYTTQIPSQWGGASTAVYDGDIRGLRANEIDVTPFLASGTDNDGATFGFQPVPGSCTGEGPVRVYSDLAETALINSYFSIGDAIDAATTLAGYVVRVDAGTYAEDLVITKSVHLRGPNNGVSPNTGSRVAEAVLHPATQYVWGENIIVNADDVTIDGFTLDGDNPLLVSGYTNVSSADMDIAEAVTAYYGGTDRLRIRNNIIRNYLYSGVSIYPYYSGAGTPSTGHEVIDNLVADIGTYDATSGAEYWGMGTLLYNNAYAAVEDNVMTNVRVGIQTGNFYQATPNASFDHGIRNNTITSRRRGIFHNLAYGSASSYPVDDNMITGLHNSNESQWDGLLLSSLSVPTTVTGNVISVGDVTNVSQGIEVWNVKSTTPVTISGGSVSGVNIGLFVNNYDGYNSNAGDGAHATVSGIDLSPNAGGIGIRILDNPSSTHAAVQVSLGSGITVTGGLHGMSIENANAAVTALGDVAFSGQGSNYIQLLLNSGDITATAATFDGVTGASATLTENFDIEDKILHAIDVGSLGFVRVKAGELFVTGNSYSAPTTTTPSLQRGIDAAAAADLLHVRAGNYGRQTATNRWVNGSNGPHQFGLFADKAISIIGYAAGDAAVTTADEASVVFETAATNNFGAAGIFIDANNVTLRGLKILDNYTAGGVVNNNKTIEVDGDALIIDKCWLTQSTSGSLYFGEWVSGTINSYSISDNRFDNAVVSVNNGVGQSGPRTQRQITGNTFNGTQTSISYAIGLRGWNGASPVQGWIVNPVGGAVITGNTFNQNLENLIWARGNAGGYIESQIDWNEIWTANTFNTRKVVALTDYPTFAVRSYVDAGGYPVSRRIGTAIQTTVNLAQNGDIVLAGPGTYTEQVTVTKSLDIRGANYGVDPNTASRSSESTMLLGSASERAFTVNAGNTNVSVDGFHFDSGSPLHDGNYTLAPRTSDVTFRHNLVENSNNIFSGTSTSWRNVLISNNRFVDVNGTASSSAMLLNAPLTVTVQDNTFTNMNYGAILIDNASSVSVTRNTIDGTGFQAIQLANAIGAATVSENVINNANLTSGNADRAAIRLYGSGFTGSVVVRNNTITGGYTGIAIRSGENITGKDITVTENSITGLAGGKAIYHGGTGSLSAPCNWYGASLGADVAALVNGDVAYMPFLTSGTDDAPGTMGFQPLPLSCNGYYERVVVYADQSSITPLGVYNTIQEGIDAAADGNDVRIHAGTYAESPVVHQDVTFKAVENTLPLLASGEYFILGTTGLGNGTFVNFHNDDLNTIGVNSNGRINDAIGHVNSNGLVLLTQTAEYGLANAIFSQTVALGDKAVTIRGQGQTGTLCDVAPVITIDGGSGIVLYSTGSANKVIENVDLKISGNAAARFAQIGNGSSTGNITARNVRFFSGSARILGLQQLTKPVALADGEDIPEYVDDGNDPAFGSGRFIYEEGAPFLASTMLAAWKGNDANPTSIENVYDFSVGNNTLSQTTAKNRPSRTDDFPPFNYNDAITFVNTGDRVLTAKSKAEIVTGNAKTVFVVFRTPANTSGVSNRDVDRVIYKHGDDDYGLNISFTDDEKVQFNIYSNRAVALATHEFGVAPSTTAIAQLYFDGASALRRVGVSVDIGDDMGNTHYEQFFTGAQFPITSLQGPANYGTASNINVGGLNGEAYIDGTAVTTKTPKNTFNGGNIGEIIVLNTADASVRDEVYCYLHTKYNLGDNENGLERISVEYAEEEESESDGEQPLVWPNPATTAASVAFTVPHDQTTTVTVVDLLGRTVATITTGVMEAGRNVLEFSTQDLTSGVYAVQINGETFSTSARFIVR